MLPGYDVQWMLRRFVVDSFCEPEGKEYQSDEGGKEAFLCVVHDSRSYEEGWRGSKQQPRQELLLCSS